MAAHGHAPVRFHDLSPHVGYVRVRLVDGAAQWELRQFVARLTSRSTAKFLKDPCRSKGCSRSEFISSFVAGVLSPGVLACVVPSRRQSGEGSGVVMPDTEHMCSSMFLLALLVSPPFLGNSAGRSKDKFSAVLVVLLDCAGISSLVGLSGGIAALFAPGSDAWQEIQDWSVRRNHPVAPGVSVLDLLVALSAMVADHGGSCGLRGSVSRLFAEVARVLDGCAFSCIQSPAVDASIQDLVRCSLTGSSGKRRRLDPHITGLASIKHNVSQAGLCASHAGALHSPDEAWHSTRPTTLAFHVCSTPVRVVRVSVCTPPCTAPMEAKQLKCCVSDHVALPSHPSVFDA